VGSTDTQKMKIAVAATFTAEPLLRTLHFWGEKLQWHATVEFAGYNQVFQQLLDPGSLFGGNSHGANILLVRPEDWLRYESSGIPEAKEKLYQSRRDLIAALRSAAQRSAVPYIVCLCPASPTTVLKDQLRLEERCIYSDLQDAPGVEVFTSQSLFASYPVSDYYDPERDKMAHIPYTEEFFAALGTSIVRKLHLRQLPPYKVIAVDCDETLWTGVCGEVGAAGIEIGSHRKHLQEFLIHQQEAGMLLCLCSKNNPEDVEEVFQRRSDMPLKREHITASRVNWQPKAENLRALAAELQLGLDSFIFIDDNPLECGQVKASCPEVLTLELPQDLEQIPAFLANVWAFDRQKVTEEDRTRAASYRQNRERDQFQRQAPSLENFLSGLQLEIDISPMAEAQIPRVAQLTQRTNQFNCTTVRRTEDAVRQSSASGELECLTVQVKDRFGDYGLVGAMLVRRAADALEVDSFLLSCRVLGRGVEHRMLATLGRLAQSRSLARVDVRFVPSKKNGPALSFLESVAGEFKVAGEADFWFRIPSEYAAKLSERQILSTLRVAAEKVEQQAEQAGSTSLVVADSQLMQDIATRFNTPAEILAATQKDATTAPAATGGSRNENDIESTIIGAWSQALGTQEITRDSDFFALGGDSLPAVQVIIQLNQAFEISLALQDVFDYPTVKSLAEAVKKALQEKQKVSQASDVARSDSGESAEASGDSRSAADDRLPSAPALSTFERRKVLSPCPLSFAQESWWVMNEWAPNSPDLSSCVLRLKGNLDIGAMERTLGELVERHEALRTTFESTESGPVQIISSSKVSMELPLVDLRASGNNAEERAVQIIEEESVKPFDFGSDLMLRPTLLRVGDDDYILILIVHHIAFDASSREILLQELEALYTAFAEGKKNPLPPLARQYADFAVWQRNLVGSGALQGQLDYWKPRLAGIPTRLDLPRTRNTVNMQLSRGSHHSSMLPSGTAEALRVLAQREGITLFMLLLGAFQTLLHRYSAQDDIVVGSAEAGRFHPHTQSVVGCFVNVLPLRTDLSGNPTFRELLARVRETVLQARSNQDVPLPRLIQELAPERQTSQAPLFQALFSLEKPLEAPQLPGLKVSVRELDTRTALYDIQLYAAPTREGIRLNFEWNRELFDRETIERMSQHFHILLTSIAENANERIDSLDMLPQAERRRLLVEWNDTHVEYPTTVSLISLIEQQVERTPDATALVCSGEQLTYSELNSRANQLARHLRSVGVGPDVLAGVCLERSVEMVVSLLAILKAGGAYVPFDPDYPQRRLQQMLDDAKPPVVLSVTSLLSRLPESASNVLCLDRDGKLFEHQDKSNLPSQIGGENLAYAIYTSGSTGIPKGVPNTHQGIVNRLLWMQDAFQLTSTDRVLQKTPYSFDVSVWEFFWPLLTGATLVMARPGGHKDPAYLVDLIAQEKITTLHFVPSMLSIFLESEGLDRCTSLKQVFASGEALLPEMQQRFFEQLPAKLHNLYGPTEAAVDVTYWTCTPTTKLASIPIGRPIANIQIYILDRFLQPVPVGIPGELHIGGIGLARGYLNRPELTAEKFIQNPYGKPEDRLYKTGDLARFLPDGNVEYLGRIDQQVKVRGFRIELGEIESVLEEHPDVVQAVVVARNEGGGEKSLLACIVPKVLSDAPANSPVTPAQLRVYLQSRLPEYMVPAAFTMLKQIPMTSSGKADRRALLEMNFAPVQREVAYIPPRTPLEEEVAAVWKEVLGLAQVGVQENFFEIGGHSLKATKVVMLLRNKLGINASLRLLFEHATIGEMSEALMQLLLDQAEEPALAEMIREVESLSDDEIDQLRASNAEQRAAEIEPPLPSPAGTTQSCSS
jgi:amino acid adenylation domain-containing protein/FkbH-like protein